MIAFPEDGAHEPWTGEHLRWHIARGAAQLVRERRAAAPPSEAEVCDALDVHVELGLRAGPRDPEALATGLVLLEAVDAVRVARGHVATPAVDVASPAAQVAAGVVREVIAEIVRRPALTWAHDLRAQACARVAAGALAAGIADRGPALPRPRGFIARAQEHVQRGCPAAERPRLALALRDAEAQAIVDLIVAAVGGPDVEAALRQLAALARTRASLGLDRDALLALVRQRLPIS
ncbi:MAG: hypothetical protein JNK64_22735 [Myxococcales bacterium]|nr:hypothetical protein [Myxococcales bacterium]